MGWSIFIEARFDCEWSKKLEWWKKSIKSESVNLKGLSMWSSQWNRIEKNPTSIVEGIIISRQNQPILKLAFLIHRQKIASHLKPINPYSYPCAKRILCGTVTPKLIIDGHQLATNHYETNPKTLNQPLTHSPPGMDATELQQTAIRAVLRLYFYLHKLEYNSTITT